MGTLDGKTALVTGGGTGIGLATAQRFADDGAHVFISGRRKAELAAAADIIGADRVTPVVADISDLDDLDRMYAEVADRGHGLDVLFANAGWAVVETLERTTVAQLAEVFDINVRGTLFTVQKALPLLNDGASVILNASTAADHGTEAFGVYAASKGAVKALTLSAAVELAPRGIRVNDVAPGMTKTPLYDSWLAGTEDPARSERDVLSRIPLGRLATPDDVAAAVAYLVSDDAQYVTGTTLKVDGGYTAQ